VDEFRVWSIALTPDELLEYYDFGIEVGMTSGL